MPDPSRANDRGGQKHISRVLLLAYVLLVGTGFASAQFKDQELRASVRFGGIIGNTELEDGNGGYQVRAFLRHPILPQLHGEVGGGFGEARGKNYRHQLAPLDYRVLLSPGSFPGWTPFFYLGVGGVYYLTEREASGRLTSLKRHGWSAYIPGGIGAQIKITDRVLFEFSGGYGYVLNDEFAVGPTAQKDGFWGLKIGILGIGESDDADPDRDGLTNREERRLGTGPRNPDTDGDGLSDGDEVFRYKTDPLNPDTDGDGLKDGEEILIYRTDPRNPNTDGDGLTDGEEVHRYKTDPLNPDTDGDRLTDGDEVHKYGTNPLLADTDGGGVDDGVEVRRGTNPLDPSDDIVRERAPRVEVFKAEIGAAIVLEGVTFRTGSATISPESEPILRMALNTLIEYPDIEVEIHGHTDNTGRPSVNLQLSRDRAEAVKRYLVDRGIDPRRIMTRGFASVKPIASNDTEEGRRLNRRIEFVRIK